MSANEGKKFNTFPQVEKLNTGSTFLVGQMTNGELKFRQIEKENAKKSINAKTLRALFSSDADGNATITELFNSLGWGADFGVSIDNTGEGVWEITTGQLPDDSDSLPLGMTFLICQNVQAVTMELDVNFPNKLYINAQQNELSVVSFEIQTF